MCTFGYDNDQHPICKILNSSMKKSGNEFPNHNLSDNQLIKIDQDLQECAKILKNNLDKTSNSNRQIVDN